MCTPFPFRVFTSSANKAENNINKSFTLDKTCHEIFVFEFIFDT